MIEEIIIKNFALIEDLKFSFKSGFNVIMGETGAGKSNIIDAISLIFGDRASKEKIRKGADRAYLSISLDISGQDELIAYLKSQDLYEEDEFLIISRTIYKKSSTLSKVNDISVTAKILKNIASYIIDIYGQFENILILSRDEQLRFLDNIGDSYFKDLLIQYGKVYNNYIQASRSYKEFKQSPEEINRNLEFLEYQIKEIEDSNIFNLNEEEILSRLELIENSQEITENGHQILSFLNDDDYGVLTNLGRIEANLDAFTDLSKDYQLLRDRVHSTYIELDDISSEIIYMLDEVEFDEEEYSNLNGQRDTIFQMKRKYGDSIDEIKEFYESSLETLDNIKNYEEMLEALKRDKDKYYEEALNLAEEISKIRKSNALVLEEELIKQLSDLDMTDSFFKVNFKRGKLKKQGFDEISFLVSFNKNQDLMELSKVASGGEISRFMLAIKSIEANIDQTPILIFDEIDTGISGDAGNIVGDKLKELSKNRILISVSHLAQIISKADYQFLVQKNYTGHTVSSSLKLLNNEERVVELAKIIQGSNYNENTLKTARNMLIENKG